MSRLCGVMVVACLVALAAGCDDPDAVHTAAGPEANCPTESNVAQATGLQLNGQEQLDSSRYRDGISYRIVGCSYRTRTGGEVSVARIGRGDSDTGTFEVLRRQAKGVREEVFEPLAGLDRDAWVDGERIAVRNGKAMLFIELKGPNQSSTERTAAEARLARRLLTSPTASSTKLDCGAVKSVVEQAIAKPTYSALDISFDKSAGVEFRSSGCSFSLPSDREVTVVSADSIYWDGWVAGKKRKEASEYTESEVLGHKAFTTEGTLIVDDGESPVEVRTSGIDDTAAKLTALRANTARLVL